MKRQFNQQLAARRREVAGLAQNGPDPGSQRQPPEDSVVPFRQKDASNAGRRWRVQSAAGLPEENSQGRFASARGEMMHRMHKKMHNMHKYADGYAKLCKIMHVMHLQKAQAGGANQNASDGRADACCDGGLLAVA